MRNLINRILLLYRDISMLGEDYFVIKISSFRESHDWSRVFRTIVILIFLISVISLSSTIFRIIYSSEWTGFGETVLSDGIVKPSKTLWDWMDLLLIPFVLAIIVFLFNRSERRNEQRIAIEKQREETLREYLDQMAELFIKTDLKDEQASSAAMVVGRARTLAILGSLDGHRKGILLRFLYEMGFISIEETVIGLDKADLTDIILQTSTLDHVNLRGSNLDRAKLQRMHIPDGLLSGSSMRNTDLRSANFRNSNLEYVLLDNSNMYMANLEGARMGKARLNGACLAMTYMRGTYIPGAKLNKTSLRKADLTDAVLDGSEITNSNLKNAKLCNASLVEVNLSGSNLKGADLSGADLTRAIVSKKQLRRAKSIKNAVLDGVQERLGRPQMKP